VPPTEDIMLKNYLKIAVRNIVRYKGYSFINIAGLAIGMACAILIALWVRDEISFDRFHKNGDNLYFVASKLWYGGKWQPGSGTPPALGPALKKEYPGIVNTARLQNGEASLVIRYGEKMYNEKIQAGDFSLLQMFSFPLVKGDLDSALTNPHGIFLTERMAEKYFGKKNPVGKVLNIDNKLDLAVVGVLKNMPQNSLIRFEFLVPIEIVEEINNSPGYTQTWTNFSFVTLAQLREDVSAESMTLQIKDRIMKSNNAVEKAQSFLTRYRDVYLFGITGHGWHIGRIILFSFIAVIILLIACFNFMNLATARSANRAKEVGMRKVVGASRKSIIYQFFSESLLISLISFFFSLILVSWFLPAFNNLAGKQLTLDISNVNWFVIVGAIALVGITGLTAGSYPALFLSAFRPVKVLQGTLSSGSKASTFRKVLVVGQFAASIALIICTAVVFRQMEYVSKRNLGFEKEQTVYFRLKGEAKQKYSALKHELSAQPGVQSVTTSQALLNGVYWNGHNWRWEGKELKSDPLVTYLHVDADFIKTFNMELVDGDFFPPELAYPVSENTNTVVVNEAFAGMMGTDNPVGRAISKEDRTYTIIGVVKDFHYKPLYNRIGPLIFFVRPQSFNILYAKIGAGNIDQTIDRIETVFKKFNPRFPFQYSFLDETFDRQYRSEKRIGKIFRSFAFLAIFISCLGLFGLASFMAEQRTKEIGIRKILGSSMGNIIVLLLKEFVKWVVIANIIAWPAAYSIMSSWLRDFAYRTGIGLDLFIFSGLAALAIAVITVSYQSIKSATANPVEALRYE
jgi:ABC-type antimicrobial peptide transport system permease subunit